MQTYASFSSGKLAPARRAAGIRRRAEVCVRAVNIDQLKQAKAACDELVRSKPCQPIMVRLAWHDAGTFDVSTNNGGATGTIRFDKEITAAPNSGLANALKLLEPIKEKFPDVTWADLLQMASAASIESVGGPTIPMRYGRRDLNDGDCGDTDGLPAGNAPFPTGDGPGGHLRTVFYRMGFNDQEIVALSGAHTLGRAYKNRSGVPKVESTKYTKDGPGTPGGQSWTPEWLKFDNSYFVEVKRQMDPDLLVMETDDVIFKDEGFAPHANRYHDSNDVFFKEYALAHAKLSELGARWEEGAPVTI